MVGGGEPRMNGILLRACCPNCRHYERDRATHIRHFKNALPGFPKPFCPELGLKDNICDKFVPRRVDVHNAIWREKHKEAAT